MTLLPILREALPGVASIGPPRRWFSAHRIRSRSEEHTSELQSQSNLVCRLLLEKKNNIHLCIAALRRTTDPPPAPSGRALVCPSALVGRPLPRPAIFCTPTEPPRTPPR